MDNHPISCYHLGEYFQVDGKQLQQQYKEHISDYSGWQRKMSLTMYKPKKNNYMIHLKKIKNNLTGFKAHFMLLIICLLISKLNCYSQGIPTGLRLNSLGINQVLKDLAIKDSLATENYLLKVRLNIFEQLEQKNIEENRINQERFNLLFNNYQLNQIEVSKQKTLKYIGTGVGIIVGILAGRYVLSKQCDYPGSTN